MSSNPAFNFKSQNNKNYNRAPGSERRQLAANNVFMTSSPNIFPNASRSRSNSGELNLTPGADRPYRSENNSTPTISNSTRSSPNSEQYFTVQYEHLYSNLAPGSNRPPNNALFGQLSSNPGVASIMPNHSFQSLNMSSIRKYKPVIPDSNEIKSMDSNSSAIANYASYAQLATQMISAINDEERKTRDKLVKDLAKARSSICSQIERYSAMESNVNRIILNVEKDIKNSIQWNIELLERRERELLNYLEEQKRKQLKALNEKIQDFNEYNLKITQLNDVLASIQNSNNLDEIKKINSAVSKEIKSLTYKMSIVTPLNPLVILFQEADAHTQHSIASFGGLISRIVEMANRVTVQDLCKKGRAILGTPFMIKVLHPRKPFSFGNEFLCRPWGVCCDQNGNIYVGDRSNNRITIFKPNGAFIGEIGKIGSGPLEFNRPAGIAIDLLGRLIVADKDNHRVQIVGRNGKLINQIGGVTCSDEDGQFNYPWDVAVNMKGDIVVTDSRNRRIQLFDLHGRFIGKFCFDNVFPVRKPKTEPSPRSVCFSPTGDILVADFHHLCVVAISHDLRKYQVLQLEKQFSRPQGIACDDFGNIIIADSRDHQIKVFRQTGQLLFAIGQSGVGLGEFDHPSGICLTPEGRIVCVDFGNNRLQVF